MVIRLSIFVLSILTFPSCASDNRVDDLEAKLNRTIALVDSLVEAGKPVDLPEIPYFKYTWFDLGQEYHRIVNDRFYVTSISATFKQNGYQVSGVIANLDALSKSTVKIECAIFDTSRANALATAFKELPRLPSGIKVDFSIFVPTTKTDVTRVGVKIENYRM